MSNGVAYFVRSLTRGFYSGSALYKVEPPATWNDRGFLTSTAWVIVAVSPEAVDHGQPETKCFAAKPNGRMWHLRETIDYSAGKWKTRKINDFDESDFDSGCIVGEQNPIAALRALECGYELMIGPVNKITRADEPETWLMMTRAEQAAEKKEYQWPPPLY